LVFEKETDTYARERDTVIMELAGPKGGYAVPSLKELGMKPTRTPRRSGETVALKTLADITPNANYTATFEKLKTVPTAFDPAAM